MKNATTKIAFLFILLINTTLLFSMDENKTTDLRSDDNIDIQFFPEGGELVDGLHSKIAFKAVDIDGKGTFVEGEIVNRKGNVVSTFKSNEFGIGYFEIEEVKRKDSSKARLKNSEQLIKLPKV